MAKKGNSKLLIYILLVVVLLLIGIAVIKSKSKPRGEQVDIEKVELRTIRETVTASGKIFPEKEVKISSDVSGEIVELFVQEGDSVRAGQVLARIDPEAYLSAVDRAVASLNNSKSSLAMQQAAIKNSEAQMAQIQAQLDNARTIHQRNQQLLNDGVISQQDYDASLSSLRQIEANMKSAEASLASSVKGAEAAEFSVKGAEASLKEIRTSLSRTTIHAPTEGIVSRLNVEQGERVVGTIQMTGTEMMRIANFNTMEVQVEVSENDILRVSLGDTCDIEVDAYLDQTFQGIVTAIASSALTTGTAAQVSLTSDQVTNFVVKIRILPESYADLITERNRIPFRPGMSASVDIYTNTIKDAVSVPIAAVTTREKDKDESAQTDRRRMDEFLEVVFVFEADTARMAEVQTGIQDNEYIYIVEGLKEGEEIVTGPYSVVSRKLKSGDRLRKKEEK